MINVSAMDLVSRYRILNRETPYEELEVASKLVPFVGAPLLERLCTIYIHEQSEHISSLVNRFECAWLHSVLHSILYSDGSARSVRPVCPGTWSSIPAAE